MVVDSATNATSAGERPCLEGGKWSVHGTAIDSTVGEEAKPFLFYLSSFTLLQSHRCSFFLFEREPWDSTSADARVVQ